MDSARIQRLVTVGAVICLLGLSAGERSCPAASGADAAGESFDAAPFAAAVSEEPGKSYGVTWAEPRKVRRIEIEFDAGAAIPAAETLRVQYWHKAWDGGPDPIQAETGVARAGWTPMDDWTNGQWKEADVRAQVDGQRWTCAFAPSGEKEFSDLGQPGVSYRKTLKVRVVALPEPSMRWAMTGRPSREALIWKEKVTGLPLATGQ